MSHLTETFIDEEREISYSVEATWSFLERLKAKHRSLNGVYISLSSGELNPEYIKDVIASSVISVNSEFVNDAQRDKVAIEIIERFGLQEASMFAREMISRSMVGDIKKSQLDRNLETKSIMSQLLPSLKLSHFWKVGLAWITVSILSGVLGSWIFSWLTMHT